MGFDKKKIDNCLYATMYRRYATKRYVNIYGVPDAYIPLNVPEIADIWNEKKTKEFLDADNWIFQSDKVSCTFTELFKNIIHFVQIVSERVEVCSQ